MTNNLLIALAQINPTVGDIALAALGAAGYTSGFREKILNSGLEREKSILRIHVYDEATTSHPDLATWALRTADDSAVAGTDSGPTGSGEEFINVLKGKSFSYWKTALRTFYPSIIHGTSTGTVIGVSISSKTGQDLGNVAMIDAYEQIHGLGKHGNQPDFDETILFPSVLTLETMGNPTISRGSHLFIDFGTNTSLDNIYVVNSVHHSIGAGQFITTCQLVAPNQGAVRSFKGQAISKITAILNLVT